MTGRCRRAEVRDASVGLNVSNALDVGARAVRGKVGNAEGRRRVLSLPSPSPTRARSLTHVTAPPPWRTPHSTPTVRRHIAPSRPYSSRVVPIDLAATHFTSRRGWNKVPPGGMVTPRRRRRHGARGRATEDRRETANRTGEGRIDGGEEGLEG